MLHFCLYYIVLSGSCSLVVTCWEKADLLALLCIMFSCVFVTFPFGVSGQVWYLIVAIPDLCVLLYFCELCDCSWSVSLPRGAIGWPVNVAFPGHTHFLFFLFQLLLTSQPRSSRLQQTAKKKCKIT